MSEQFLEQIDNGAKELLKIAIANDKAQMLFENKALSNTMKGLSRLHELTVNGQTDQIINWFKLPAKGRTTFFIHLTAAFLKAMQTANSKATRMEISDYDHFVLMAAAETLSEIMWQDKKETDIPGPDLKECIEEYGLQSLDVILQVFIKNYIGNILQYLFEAAKVRVANPKLPPETEVELKEKEAVAISNYVFSNLLIDTNIESTAKRITEKLNLAQYLILSQS